MGLFWLMVPLCELRLAGGVFGSTEDNATHWRWAPKYCSKLEHQLNNFPSLHIYEVASHLWGAALS